MRIVCVGGGPAGLYFAICAKRRDAGHDVTVLERHPRGATYGWGVGYWEDLLDELYRNDPVSAARVRGASALWRGRELHLREQQPAYLSGYGYSVNRSTLLDMLARRAEELGVTVKHGCQVNDLAEAAGADLVVACDGAGSQLRHKYRAQFGTHTRAGRNRYIWLGTRRPFTSLTFAFEHTDAGWIWMYGYPSGPGISTCVVECSAQTWRGLGLDEDDRESGLRTLEKTFDAVLDGHALIGSDRGRAARWSQYLEVGNDRWHHDNVVLVGDAARTVHFTMGSGMGLALKDAAVLAESLNKRVSVSAALERYERRRRVAIHRTQAAARTSMAWFENVDYYADRPAVDLAYAMATRYQPQLPWRYLAHHATQFSVVRQARQAHDSARRWHRAVRRGQSCEPPRRSQA